MQPLNLLKTKKSYYSKLSGGSYFDIVPGKIYFNYEGTEYSFEPTVRSSGRYFIAFGDLTNGESTYGGGRFLYLDPPDSNNNMTIDFNMAYNPPCVFSILPHALCLQKKIFYRSQLPLES